MLIVDHERLTRLFFRRVNSCELFRLFFEEFGVWETMGLDANATADTIYAAWDKLQCPKRNEIKEALCRINDIAHEKGRFTLQRRAQNCGVEDYEDLTLQKLAMTLYLDHRQVFDEAYGFFVLEKTENLHILLGRKPVACTPTASQIDAFRQKLITTLRPEGEGPKLRVEVEARHADKWMASIPYQTFVKPDHEFDDRSEIITRDRRPIYEMILIFYPATGLLKLKVGRGRQKAIQVASVFATQILGQDADFFQICEVVSFEPLQNPRFAFQREPGDHFEWALPMLIRFTKSSADGVDYQIHCKDLVNGAAGVLGRLQADGISLTEIDIQALNICFKFPKNRRDTRMVELGRPGRISLDETDRDRYIESVLTRWGFINHAAKKQLARAGIA
ncbi:MAG: hypothetical protein COV75_08495 [Candidatus Omnitrophica bacterium CG11_big_fil_rev_8_21_14_0_20_63_9]|nr:MAG: hypothetical protein COV75_08495 [Candidatus Omnitrophica bacterium CG11_big_fil_rev_8_21_14_0_20_63_9]